MIKKPKYRFVFNSVIILLLAVIGTVNSMYSQSTERDTAFHPYHVNYWVTGGILAVGLTITNFGVPQLHKSTVTDAEMKALNRNDINPIDRWALEQDPSRMGYFGHLSNQVTGFVVLIPLLTLLDHDIRQDWLDVLLIYAETQAVVNSIYLYSPLGPAFQNKFRPVVYYDAIDNNSPDKTPGRNRNSFYSGHTASVASATFFAAKVFCDYHPKLGWKKYLIYGAAAIPPLVVGYLRIKALTHFPSDVIVGYGIGALCGILIPEFHRIKIENVSLGLYPSFEGMGICMKWQPGFLK
jgi:membrane-associated phospholipid phosphatase